MDFVNYLRQCIFLILAFLAINSVHANAEESLPSLGIDGVTEENINGILFISPVTDANIDTVRQRLRQRMGLRELSVAESNRLYSDVPAGTYYYAYGFQLAKDFNDPGSFLVSARLGSPWFQYEMHTHSDGGVRLLGLMSDVDYQKFEFYSKTYGPTPKLTTHPVGDFNILVILPFDMVTKIIYTELAMEQGTVSTVDAAILPVTE